jgi:diguanylate cyclase (GGDEF)-like protein
MLINLIGLDIKTIMSMISIALAMQVVMMIFLCFLVKNYRGIKTFTAARIASLIGYSLIFSQIQPLSSTVGIGSCLLVFSSSLGCLGIAKFTNRKIKTRYLVAYNLAFVFIQAFLILFQDIFLFKTAAQSIFQIVLLGVAIYLLASSPNKSFIESMRFLMAVFLALQLVLGLRLVALIDNPVPNFFAPSKANSLSLVAVFIYTFLLTTGFTMMVCQRLYYDLRLAADTDELTKLLNRRAIMRFLEREVKIYNRVGETFSIILIDVDHFKKVNDQYGHDGGDMVLVHVAEILNTQLRDIDFASRWGGEEFLILLPAIGVKDSLEIAERLRAYVEQTPAVSGISVTVSLGIAVIDNHGDSVERLITAADHALYAAKKSGRNQVKIAKRMNLNSINDC